MVNKAGAKPRVVQQPIKQQVKQNPDEVKVPTNDVRTGKMGPLFTFSDDNKNNQIGEGDKASETLPNGTTVSYPVLGVVGDNSQVGGIKLGKYDANGQIMKDSQGHPILNKMYAVAKAKLKQASAILKFQDRIKTDEKGNEEFKGEALAKDANKKTSLGPKLPTEQEMTQANTEMENDTTATDSMASPGAPTTYGITNSLYAKRNDAADKFGNQSKQRYVAEDVIKASTVNLANPSSNGVFGLTRATELSVKTARTQVEAPARQNLATPTTLDPKLTQELEEYR